MLRNASGQRLPRGDPCIIHQNVHPAEGLRDLLHGPLHGGVVRQIGPEAHHRPVRLLLPQLRQRSLHGGLPAAEQRHLCPIVQERPDNGKPDAARSAGHDRNFSV